MHQDCVQNNSNTDKELRWKRLAPWLALLCLLWLFAPHSTSHYDSDAVQTTSILQIGVGAASWVSVTRKVSGQQHLPEAWDSTEVDWHPTPVTAVPVILLLLLMIMRPTITLDALSPGLKGTRQAAMHYYQRYRPILATSAVAGLLALMVFGFALPQQHRTIIDHATTAELKALQAGIEQQLGSNEFGYKLHLRETEDKTTELVISRNQFLLDFESAFGPLEELDVMSGQHLTHFELQAHAAALPLAIGVGLVVLLLGVRKRRLFTENHSACQQTAGSG